MPGGSQPTSQDLSSTAETQALGALSQYAGAALARYGLGPAGRGRMQARGAAAAAQKAAAAQYAQGLLQAKIGAAYADFGRSHPYEEGFVTEETTGAPTGEMVELTNWQKKLTGLEQLPQTKGRKRTESKLQARIDTRKLKLAPFTSYRVSELYGANAGYWRERGAPPPLWLTGGSPL